MVVVIGLFLGCCFSCCCCQVNFDHHGSPKPDEKQEIVSSRKEMKLKLKLKLEKNRTKQPQNFYRIREYNQSFIIILIILESICKCQNDEWWMNE